MERETGLEPATSSLRALAWKAGEALRSGIPRGGASISCPVIVPNLSTQGLHDAGLRLG
jgi:hypothetical protein